MAKRVGAAFTGQDEETDGPLKSIVGGFGTATEPLMRDAASRAALLQIGLNLMQPSWNSASGQFGEAVGHGGELVARNEAADLAKRKQDDEMDKANRTLDIRQQEADAYKVGQGNRANYDRMELARLQDELKKGNLSEAALDKFALETYSSVTNITADPANPQVARFKDKTLPEIKEMLRSDLAAAKGGGTTVPSLAGKPATIRQNGHVYNLQPDGTYK